MASREEPRPYARMTVVSVSRLIHSYKSKLAGSEEVGFVRLNTGILVADGNGSQYG